MSNPVNLFELIGIAISS